MIASGVPNRLQFIADSSSRSFANATVTVDEPRTHANITMGRGADAFSIVYTGGGGISGAGGEKR